LRLALPPRAWPLLRCVGEHGLAYARGNLDHTDGINACYLAFLTAARARGGRLQWRGEWACTHTYTAPRRAERERTSTLRPDAELRCEGPGGPLYAFLEYDRATEAKERLAAKVAQYNAYRTVQPG
jgi:hypothetical protein